MSYLKGKGTRFKVLVKATEDLLLDHKLSMLILGVFNEKVTQCLRVKQILDLP